MADWMLENHARLLEESAAQGMEFSIWLCLGGAVVTGTAVSYRRFLEEMEESITIAARSDDGSVLHKTYLPEHGLSRQSPPVDEPPEYIHLLGGLIVGMPGVRLKWLRVRLSEVGAWGMAGEVLLQPA